MSQIHRKFTPEFKSKVVLELLETGKSISEIASKYSLLPKSVTTWKKQFFENASSAFEDSVSTRKYKDEIKEKDEKIENLEKTLGRTIMERDWLSKKVGSSGLIKLSLVDPELLISITRQCELLEINRTTLYYEHREKKLKQDVLNKMDEIYTEFPYYGYRRIYRALLNENYEVCKKETYRYMGILGIKAIYPKKKINTSIPDNGKKYPYLLKNLEITRPNQVWASDITYVRLNSGFAYLCAVIDIFTRSILSWRLSYTMDDNLTISTLNDALLLFDKPEIFNSDQGSQYTAKKFIDILLNNDVAISMDSKGRAIDNIFMERFWRTIKYEEIYPSGYLNIKEARVGIEKYIHKYNNLRLHSALNYDMPMNVYREYFEAAA